MEFTDFDVFALPELDETTGPNTDAVQNVDPCPYDFVQVTDGDGTMLMNKSCGYMKVNESDPNFFVPPNITSNTNLVTVFFSLAPSLRKPSCHLDPSPKNKSRI